MDKHTIQIRKSTFMQASRIGSLMGLSGRANGAPQVCQMAISLGLEELERRRVVPAETKQWCALCGTHGDHASGQCNAEKAPNTQAHL